jgi:methyl-accepting chemotaxis protein
VAARAGQAGKEFSVVAGVLSNITTEIDDLVRAALSGAAA